LRTSTCRTNEHKGGNNKKQKKRKCNDNKFSRKNVDTLLIEMTDEQLMRHFTISQIIPKTFVHVDDVLCSHSSIFIGGIDMNLNNNKLNNNKLNNNLNNNKLIIYYAA